MAVEVGLTDGTKLVLSDENIRTDDVLERISKIVSAQEQRSSSSSIAISMFPSSGFIQLETDTGAYRVNARQIVYVRDQA
jgi:hypothetical protein